MASDFIVSGASEFSDAIDALMVRVTRATGDATAVGAHLIERNAKDGFSGNHAPGEPHVGGRKPNVVSGTLRRSINVVALFRGRTSAKAEIAPTTVYGRRIELGFHGTDSLGRVYGPPINPSPYPYFGPGFAKALPVLPRIYEDAWAAAMEV